MPLKIQITLFWKLLLNWSLCMEEKCSWQRTVKMVREHYIRLCVLEMHWKLIDNNCWTNSSNTSKILYFDNIERSICWSNWIVAIMNLLKQLLYHRIVQILYKKLTDWRLLHETFRLISNFLWLMKVSFKQPSNFSSLNKKYNYSSQLIYISQPWKSV